MNPVIKFTTLFGLLAVQLALKLSREIDFALAAVFLAVALVFVYRSFYGMRIITQPGADAPSAPFRDAAADAE